MKLNNRIYFVVQKISIEYEYKKTLKPKKWSKESPRYHITINDVKFHDLNKEQYDLLFKLKTNEQ